MKCKFTALLFMAAFYGNRVQIPVIGGIGDLSSGNALNNGSVNPYDKMTAGIGIGSLLCIDLWKIVKIITVCYGISSRICRVMHHHPFDFFQFRAWPGILIDIQKIYRQIQF